VIKSVLLFNYFASIYLNLHLLSRQSFKNTMLIHHVLCRVNSSYGFGCMFEFPATVIQVLLYMHPSKHPSPNSLPAIRHCSCLPSQKIFMHVCMQH